ncbi:hypothetical protein [Enterococcus faecium]|uniref:hypothetical protein n=3 Tax=Enterococcus faecium TaxID=1352 RepID=UPI000CF28F89|nr:hypothetical protein [Enterococcus faecium]EGP4986512.1 hypothetical protein [Enterococcus faecium]EGP5088033.1 hypothetical protein [Enterococcus faecium]EGP5140134.1 hypothetical protein [Enterococcus faecium]EME3547345.1 hypothetical protein [Enterococcus faecium]EME7139156.1 hypothetical protein [Enterococcus faecium]
MNLTRQEKQERRRQMLRIIGDRSVEELSDQELKSVQEIAETIGADTMDQSKPLPKLDLKSFTFEQYSQLREVGYSVNAIRKALGVGSSVWAKWRKANIKEVKQND